MSWPKGKPRPQNAGRKRGVPNRVTADTRKAFQMLVEGNLENMGKWLHAVAEGEKEPEYDLDGKPLKNEDGAPVMTWLRRPEPATAFKLVADLAEYHLPKLARVEHTDPHGKALPVMQVTFISQARLEHEK